MPTKRLQETVSMTPSNGKCVAAYLNGTSNIRRSTETSRPYQGHIMNICEEYAMKQMRQRTKLTIIRPRIGCIESKECGQKQAVLNILRGLADQGRLCVCVRIRRQRPLARQVVFLRSFFHFLTNAPARGTADCAQRAVRAHSSPELYVLHRTQGRRDSPSKGE